MKKLIFCVFILFTIACGDEKDSSLESPAAFSPPHYDVNIYMFDENTGINMLDPSFESIGYFCLPDKGVWAICGDKEYELSRFDRPYYNRNAPFRLERYTEDGGYRYRIVYDGFTINESFQEEMLIYWGKHLDFFTEIVIGAEVDNSGPNPQITRSLTVDGKSVICNENEDWEIEILYDFYWTTYYPGSGIDATGIWEITDLEASLDETPLVSDSSDDARFEIHCVDKDEVWMLANITLDEKVYSIRVPRIHVTRDFDKFDKERIWCFCFDQEITEGELTIDGEPQSVNLMTVRGEMNWNRKEVNESSSTTPHTVFTPQTDYHSDLTFHVECEECTFELKLNYLRVIGDRDL